MKRRSNSIIVDKFVRNPSKPFLKSLNADINHVFGPAEFATLKTWPLCQFNPKFPRKHIFQLITHTRHFYRTSHLHIHIPSS